MRLFHPTTVLSAAVVLVLLLQGVLAFEYDRSARETSPRGAQAGFPLDDAWIHQVYARSLGRRLALEFNPGEPEVGQSSLLWVSLLAPVHRLANALSVPVPRATRLLGLLVWMALALMAALVVARLPIPGARFGAFVAALLIALDPSLGFASASGMEPLLLSLCLTLALFGLVTERYLLCGVGCALTILARPEGLLLAALMAGATLMTVGPARGRHLLRVALPSLLATALWVTVCLVVSGRPFPNTYYVKAVTIPMQDALVAGLSLLAGIFENSPFYDNYVGYLFLFIGLVALLTRAGARLNLVLLLTTPCYLFGLAATRGLPEPTAFFWQRYITPVIPLLNMLAAIGFAGAGAVLTDLIRRPGRPPAPEPTGPLESEPPESEPHESGPSEAGAKPAEPDLDPRAKPVRLPALDPPKPMIPDLLLTIVLAVLVLMPLADAPRRLAGSIEEFGRNVADVDRMNVEAALWLADDPRISSEHGIATQDAGALRYFTSGGRITDLLGLNDHHLVAAGLAGEAIETYLNRVAPRVIVLLDPDPGALPFRLYAVSRGFREQARFGTEAYSLFGEPIPRALVVLADLPPR